MAHPKLVKPEQPAEVQFVLRAYEMCASLRLAVILIFTLAATLAFATFVEGAYGTAAVQFFVYQTWWFNALNALLAVNIFCAAAIRFPWQRHQTGFVVTHIGLLTLLFGAMIGRFDGIDAQIPIYEDQLGRYAFDGSDLRFDVSVRSTSNKSSDADGDMEQVYPVPFLSSPFNWADFSRLFFFNQPEDEQKLARVNGMSRFGWKMLRWSAGNIFMLANRTDPQEVVFERDNIKLEVLDFYSDSQVISAPNLQFRMSLPTMKTLDADGKTVDGPVRWVPVELQMDPRQIRPKYPFGLGASQMLGGGRAVFTMASSPNHTKAFLGGGPEGDISTQGQVILFVDGQRRVFNVTESLGKGPIPLENSSFQVEIVDYWNAWKQQDNAIPGQLQWAEDTAVTTPQSPVVVVHILDKENTQLSELVLFANNPEGNIQDYKNQIYGELWFDFSTLKQQEASRIGAGDRLEFFQTHEHKLYYRYWKRAEKKLRFTRQVPISGSPETAVEAFQMPVAQLKLYVQQFHPADKPGIKTLSKPFDRAKTLVQNRAVAKLRLTVDNQTTEKWVRIFVGTPDERPQANQVIEVAGKDRTVSVTMPSKAIDIGFRIRLKNFERKLDPGTSQASHFSSWVDFLDRETQTHVRSYNVTNQEVSSVKVSSGSLPSEGILGTNQLPLQGQIAITGKGDQLVWTNPLNQQVQRLALNNWTKATPTTIPLKHPKKTSPHPGSSGSTSEVVRLAQPTAIALHPSNSRIYWVDQQSFHGGPVTLLYGADADGRNARILLQTAEANLDSLALSSSLEKIYWADTRRGRIGRCNLDGSEPEMRFIPNLSNPNHLVIDASSQSLYWSETEIRGNSKIRRAGLDGLDPATPVTLNTKQDEHQVIRGLALDSKGKKLYWIQTENHPGGYLGKHSQDLRITSKIMSSDMLGGNRQDLQIPNLCRPTSMVFEKRRETLFWNQSASYRHDIYITMNAPVEFANPVTGKTYRLFQESFSGPWKPGSNEYEQMVLPTSEKEELYLSVLTVNADPGRWIRNLGCLFVVLGIATMFYMKAYFFKPRRKNPIEPATDKKTESPQPTA